MLILFYWVVCLLIINLQELFVFYGSYLFAYLYVPNTFSKPSALLWASLPLCPCPGHVSGFWFFASDDVPRPRIYKQIFLIFYSSTLIAPSHLWWSLLGSGPIATVHRPFVEHLCTGKGTGACWPPRQETAVPQAPTSTFQHLGGASWLRVSPLLSSWFGTGLEGGSRGQSTRLQTVHPAKKGRPGSSLL